MILIYGPANLYNESLTYVLAEELQTQRVVYSGELEVIRSACATVRNNEPVLFLLDGSDGAHDEEITRVAGIKLESESSAIVAFYNLPCGIKLHRNMLRRGVRGLFYHEDTLVILLKGVRALLNGEAWLSQATLLDLVLDESSTSLSDAVATFGVTEREVQILAHVSMGETNDEISETLGLSTHTVKAHLYNIYRKINVTNRFQASLWAAKYLQ